MKQRVLSLIMSVVMLLAVTSGMETALAADDRVVLDAVYFTVPQAVIGESAAPFETTTVTEPEGYGVTVTFKWFEHTSANFNDDKVTVLGEDDVFREGYWYEFNGASWVDTTRAQTKDGYTKYYVNGTLWATSGEIVTTPTEKLCIHEHRNVLASKATLTANGRIENKCPKCGDIRSKTAVYYPKTISLSATKYTYDGKVKKPTVKVVGSNGKTIAASNYTVTYSNNKNVGKATVKVTFKGNYSGTKTLNFTINPKNTSISGLTAGSKKFTVKIKKYTTQTTGYQIQYATNSSFKSAKTVTVKNTTTSKAITKLTAKKKYYVRIRTYKTVNKVNYYSAWSGAKTVTTKK